MRIKFNLFFILFLFLSYYIGLLGQAAIIFVSVLLHELGHVFAARKMKIRVEEVMLFPFGGVARMEDITKYGGWAEAVIALAGPVLSGIIALGTFFLRGIGDSFLLIAKYNLILMLFNIVPALPMDGGRVLRNILIFYMSYKQATRLAAMAGKAAAIALTAYNILILCRGSTNIAYLITALFIFMGAAKETKYCSYYYLLNKNNKKEIMIKGRKIRKRILNVYADTYIRFAVGHFSPANVCAINVLDGEGHLIRTLNEAEIMEGFLKYGYDGRIGQILGASQELYISH